MVALDPRPRGIGSALGMQVGAITAEISAGGSVVGNLVREMTDRNPTNVGGTTSGIRYTSEPGTYTGNDLSHEFTFDLGGNIWGGTIWATCNLNASGPPTGELFGVELTGDTPAIQLGPWPIIGPGGTGHRQPIPFQTDGAGGPLVVTLTIDATTLLPLTFTAQVSAIRYA